MPIPHDIPLPLPVDRVLLQAIIIIVFLGHIVFVNLMVGGAMFAVIFEIIGRRRPDFDTLAHEVANTVTVNKSLAVVLGVGPLLAINLLYTMWFYSANALTGHAWISIVPLVTTAFLLLYAYKYSWDRLARAKVLHIAIGAMGLAILLVVPVIFLTNINLMLFPTRWTQVRGFLSAAVLPNVWPRYLHFLLACIAVNGLFMLGWLTRAGYPVETKFQQLDRATLRKLFYAIAAGATSLQLFAGPLVLLTLPREGRSIMLYVIIGIGATFALTIIVLMWREVGSPRDRVGKLFVPVVGLLMVTGSCMGYGRHVYRETATADLRRQMAQRTADYTYAAVAADWRARHGVVQENLPLGPRVYRDSCSTCHAVDHILVGPSVQEIARLYKDNPAGIVTWARAPFKKRNGFPTMPAMTLPATHLQAVAEHMLAIGSAASQPATGPAR
jgi:cytochrome c